MGGVTQRVPPESLGGARAVPARRSSALAPWQLGQPRGALRMRIPCQRDDPALVGIVRALAGLRGDRRHVSPTWGDRARATRLGFEPA